MKGDDGGEGAPAGGFWLGVFRRHRCGIGPAAEPGTDRRDPAVLPRRLPEPLRRRTDRRARGAQLSQENAASLSAPCQRAVAAVGGSAPPAQGRKPAAAPATASPAVPAPAAPASPAPAYRAPAPPMSPRQEAFLLRRACGPDFRAYCSDAPPGGGRIIACLEANRAYLSRGCRSAILSARQGR